MTESGEPPFCGLFARFARGVTPAVSLFGGSGSGPGGAGLPYSLLMGLKPVDGKFRASLDNFMRASL